MISSTLACTYPTPQELESREKAAVKRFEALEARSQAAEKLAEKALREGEAASTVSMAGSRTEGGKGSRCGWSGWVTNPYFHLAIHSW